MVDTLVLPADHPQALLLALEMLMAGELVAFPTDTVYGVGAPVTNAAAIEKLYVAKGRDAAKAIAVLLSSPNDLSRVTAGMSAAALQLAERYWPGPLTLVVARHPGLPANLSPLPTIGVRMPNHPVALALLAYTGPLAVTSANLSGGSNTTTAEAVLAQLGGRIALLLDGGQTPGGAPSTVVDCSGPTPQILRQGPLSEEQIRAAWS